MHIFAEVIQYGEYEVYPPTADQPRWFIFDSDSCVLTGDRHKKIKDKIKKKLKEQTMNDQCCVPAKSAKKSYVTETAPKPVEVTGVTSSYYAQSLDTLYSQYLTTLAPLNPVTECRVGCIPIPAIKKKATKMYNDFDDDFGSAPVQSDAMKQRRYLADRLSSVEYDKDAELRKQFYMDADEAPKTATEFLARITAGQYLVNEKLKDKKVYSVSDLFRSWGDAPIEWRDPSKPADEAGYEAAVKAKADAVTATQDTIAIADPAAGLVALQTFEGWTYTAPTTTTVQ